MSEFNVSIGKVPGTMTQVVSDEPLSVAAAADLAGITGLEGYDVRVDGNTVNLDHTLSDDATVLFVKNAKGNR